LPRPLPNQPCTDLADANGRTLALSDVPLRTSEMQMDDQPFNFSTLDRIGAPRRHFEAGEKIFHEEDVGDAMYMVRSGRVDVVTYGTVLENVRAGGLFGEMALIDDGPRSAAAIASEPTEVVVVDKPTFLAVVRDDPQFALKVMSLLATRLRRTNKQI
jgi:CRP/FNR family transcriptional regulator, cyclic AMP receptor protein